MFNEETKTGRPFVISDLAPSDYHLFLYLKKHFAGQNIHDEDEIKIEVEMGFRQQAVNFYECGI